MTIPNDATFMTSICMHIYEKNFFPNTSLVSVKMRHLSLSVRRGISTLPKILHSPSEAHPGDERRSYLPHHCTYSFPHSSIELLVLHQLLIPEGPQCQAPQVLMIFSSKSVYPFVSFLAQLHWYYTIMAESSDHQQLHTTM